MAIYKEDIVDIELSSGSIHRSFMAHTIGLGDLTANRFGVRLFRNGVPVNIGSGTCQGFFMRPDGTNLQIQGSTYTAVSGNVAYVTLPQDAYAYEGRFVLAIKLIDSSVTGTMRIIDGMVDNTGTTGAVTPTSTIPTSAEIIAAYNNAVAVIDSSVRFDITQSLTDSEKNRARTNIGVPGYSDIDDIQNEIKIINNSVKSLSLSFEQGGIDGDTGEFVTSTIQIRTGFIYIGKNGAIKLSTTGGYRAHVRWYRSRDESTFVSGENSVSGIIIAPADYVAIVATSPSWGTIVPSEGSHVSASAFSAPEMRYGVAKTAYILSSQPISLDTATWKLTFPGSSYYVRVITSFGDKININTITDVQLSSSCVVYYKKDTNEIVTKDYTSAISDPNLYFLGVINSSWVIKLNILSEFTISGVTTTGNDTQYSFFAGYRYKPSYIAIMGDSISTYDGYSEEGYEYYPTGDVTSEWATWWGIVANGLRVGSMSDVTVSAISRTSFVPNDTGRPTSYDDTRIARLGSVHYPSYIFVNMGTNDPYMNNLGDMTYETDITALNALPNSTTKGIALTIRKLQESYPNSRIVMLIPKPVAIATVHSSAPVYTSELVNKIADRITALGNLYGVFKVIDLRKCDINQKNVAEYCEDSAIHPNALGMWRMGMYILYELLK